MICELCPRRCRVDRSRGGRGFCGAGDAARVFRWGPHFGEEPPLVGEGGSGCVFFSRCTMKCIYCQNSPWSWKGEGVDRTVAGLTEIFRELALEDRCSNWNLVSPTPYLPHIREAVRPLLKEGVCLSSGILPATSASRRLRSSRICATGRFSICAIRVRRLRGPHPRRRGTCLRRAMRSAGLTAATEPR